MDWKKWFERSLRQNMLSEEERYQAFKARLIDELKVDLDAFVYGGHADGELVDTATQKGESDEKVD